VFVKIRAITSGCSRIAVWLGESKFAIC